MALGQTFSSDRLVVTSPRLVDSSDNSGGWTVDRPILENQKFRCEKTQSLPENEISKQLEFEPKTKRICCFVFPWFGKLTEKTESSPLQPKERTSKPPDLPENRERSFASFADCRGSVVPPLGYNTI